jgi:hypothetical protein
LQAIRPATDTDLPALLELEKLTGGSWTSKQVEVILRVAWMLFDRHGTLALPG